MSGYRKFRAVAISLHRWAHFPWPGWLPAFALALFLQCGPAFARFFFGNTTQTDSLGLGLGLRLRI